MSKKGFYPIFSFVSEKGEVRYNEVLKYALSNKIVESRATVTIVLNTLTDYHVLERSVSGNRPVRTTYRLNKKGKLILHHLKEIERITHSSGNAQHI
ncbi:MAG: winged helix-turn-helix transcriptional regulator [Nitrososphaerales archaeon]